MRMANKSVSFIIDDSLEGVRTRKQEGIKLLLFNPAAVGEINKVMSITRKHSPCLDVVGEGNHTNCLPDTESDPGSDTTVQAFDTVLLIDEFESAGNRELGRTIFGGVFRHGLHLHKLQFST